VEVGDASSSGGGEGASVDLRAVHWWASGGGASC
jgi:hypothetical protein